MPETSYRSSEDVVVANTASLSAAADLQFRTLVGIQCPAVLTANTLRVGFEGSNDNSTFVPIYTASDGSRVLAVVTIARADGIPLDPANFRGWRYIKLQMLQSDGTTAVAQGAARTFQVLSMLVT
jgi:hypothetical protein